MKAIGSHSRVHKEEFRSRAPVEFKVKLDTIVESSTGERGVVAFCIVQEDQRELWRDLVVPIRLIPKGAKVGDVLVFQVRLLVR